MNNIKRWKECIDGISSEEVIAAYKMRQCLMKDALVLYFSSRIKVSFMFKVLNKIEELTNNFADIKEYYITFNYEDFHNVISGEENIDFDLCNHICGIHLLNTLFMDDYERGKLQSNPEYIKKLANDVIFQVKIREYGSKYYEVKKIIGGDLYMYYPCIYYLNVLIIRAVYKLQEEEIELCKKEKELSFVMGILKRSIGLLSVINSESFESGYSILRGIIELYATYLVFSLTDYDTKIFFSFNFDKIFYDETCDFSDSFEKKYILNGKGVNKIAYLNYGWLDDIFEFGYLGIKKSYNFSDIIALVNALYLKEYKKPNYGDELEKYYNKCHYHTHATIYSLKNNNFYFSDLCIGLGEVILGIVSRFNNKTQLTIFNDVDIEKKARESIDLIKKIISNNQDKKFQTE